MDRLTIEPLKTSDLDQITQIERYSFPDPWGGEVIKRKFASNPKAFRVIKDVDKILGFYCAEERQTTNTKGEKEIVALLSTIAVTPKYLGKGLGEALLKDAIVYLQRISSKRIVLHTRIDNEAMIRLAQKKGFRMVGIIPDFYYEATRDAYEFEFPRGN